MSLDAEMARIVRRYMAGLDRDAGSTAPQSLDNQATPVLDTAANQVSGSPQAGTQSAFADMLGTSPARQGCPNDFAWRVQSRAEMGAYREHMAFATVADGDTATIYPDAACNWWFDCEGSLTLEMQNPEDVPNPDPYMPEPSQAILVTVFIYRPKGASIQWPAAWLFSADVRASTATTGPFSPAAIDGQVDVFTIMTVPNRATLVFPAGAAMS